LIIIFVLSSLIDEQKCLGPTFTRELPSRPKSRRLGTLEILITSAPNYAHVKVISLLTPNCNLVELMSENKMSPSSE